MSQPGDPESIEPEAAEGELVDALPAVVAPRPLPTVVRVASLPVRQAVRVAGVSFATGAVASLVARRQGTRYLARRRRRSLGPLGQIAASRSFLVDIHLLRND